MSTPLVLLVDDDDDSLMSIREALEAEGYHGPSFNGTVEDCPAIPPVDVGPEGPVPSAFVPPTAPVATPPPALPAVFAVKVEAPFPEFTYVGAVPT